MARLSLICPTMGRSTLTRLIDTVLPQMKDGDEFIIVGDGPIANIGDLLGKYPRDDAPTFSYVELPTHVGDFGCTPCDFGIELSSGDVVWFIGDDDICAPGAFDAIRKAVDAEPNLPHLFAMMHSGNRLGNRIEGCMVSGQQIVIPRDMTKMPKMADVPRSEWHVSDFIFIVKVHTAWDSKTIFHDEIIAILPTQNRGKML